jgi:hypothetical protein
MAERGSGTSMVSGVGWGASLLVVLGLFAHRASQAPATKNTGADEKPKTAATESATTDKDPRVVVSLEPRKTQRPSPPEYLWPIAQYFGTTIEELCRKGPSSGPRPSGTVAPEQGGGFPSEEDEADYWVSRWGDHFPDRSAQFLIALLPDPDRSRSSFRFDLYVEAIQRAASAEDRANARSAYVLDHYYLPWKRSGSSHPRDPDAPTKFPGLLLFRSVRTDEKPPGRLLVVLLVGEAPMGGVQKRSLGAALDIVSWFGRRQLNAGESPDPIRIVGPVFSGSQDSIQFALRTWWDKNKEVYPLLCRSGAEPTWSIEVISTATALQPDDVDEVLSLPARLHLKTTCIPDKVLVEHLLTLVELENARLPVRVAHLRESNTGFGAEVRPDELRNALNKSNPSPAAKAHPRLDIIDVPFPLHISGVHAKHDDALRRDEANLPQFGAFDRGLKIPSDEGEGAADTIPQQNELMTAVYQDISLSSALQTLERLRAPYVLISATDPRDKIFLASVVEKHCPDARLLITIGDQLYTHSDYVRYLSGAYIASCYPLSPVVTKLKRSAHDLWQLTSFGENLMFSYYNAVAAQMGKFNSLLLYKQMCETAPDPYVAVGLGIWLSQIGPDRADVIRIEQLTPDDQSYVRHIFEPPEPAKAVSELSFPEPEPTIWWPIWLAGVNAVLAVVFAYGRGLAENYCKTRTRHELLKQDDRDNLRARQRRYLLLASHVLAVFTICIATGYLTGVVLKPGIGPPKSLVTILLANVIAIVLTAWMACEQHAWSSGLQAEGKTQVEVATGKRWPKWLSRSSWIILVVVTLLAYAIGFVYSRSDPAAKIADSLLLIAHYLPGCALVILCELMGLYVSGKHIHSVVAPVLLGVASLPLGFATGLAVKSLKIHDIDLHWLPLLAIAGSNVIVFGLIGWDLFWWQFAWRYGWKFDSTEVPRAKAPWYLPFVAIALAIIAAALYLGAFCFVSGSESTWAHARVVNVIGWNSPIVPLLLILALILCWCWLHVARTAQLNDIEEYWDPLDVYSAKQKKEAKPSNWIEHRIQKLRNENRKTFIACSQWPCWPLTTEPASEDASVPKVRPNWYMIAAIGIASYGLSIVLPRFSSGPDGPVISAVGVGIFVSWLLIAWEVGRLWNIWTRLETVHRAAARLPMQRVFANLPEYVVRKYGALIFVEQFRARNSPGLEQQLQWVVRRREDLRRRQSKAVKSAIKASKNPSNKRVIGSLAREYCRAIMPELIAAWFARSVRESYVCLGERGAGVSPDVESKPKTAIPQVHVHLRRGRAKTSVTASHEPASQAEVERQVQQADEELFGIMLVTYLSQYRIQLKALAFFLIGAPILLLLATASYSFMAQGVMMDFTALLTVACLIAIGAVYSGLNRDEFLSRVTATTPRWYSFNPDSVTTFLVILLPLMLALASRLPGGQVVYNWISSVIRSIPSQS